MTMSKKGNELTRNTFRKLLPTAMRVWTYDDCKLILKDCRPMIRRLAKYVINKKFHALCICFLISVTSYSQRQQHRAPVDPAYISLEGTYITLQAVDVITTQQFLALGGREMNPVGRWMINNRVVIPGKILATSLTLYGCRKLYHRDRQAAYLSLVLMNVMYSAVVLNNYQVCVKLRI